MDITFNMFRVLKKIPQTEQIPGMKQESRYDRTTHSSSPFPEKNQDKKKKTR